MTDHIEEPNKLTVGDRDEGDEALATRIVEVLRGQPQDHTIYWNDPPTEDGMYHTFVDIWAPIVCEPLEIGWAWTIADDNEDSSLQPLTLIVKPDVIVDGQPAWRASTINRTLEAWTTEHARRTDLRFASDSGLVPPLVRYLLEADQEHKRTSAHPTNSRREVTTSRPARGAQRFAGSPR